MQKNKKNVPNMNSNMDLIPFAFIMKRGHDTKNLNLKNLRQGFTTHFYDVHFIDLRKWLFERSSRMFFIFFMG